MHTLQPKLINTLLTLYLNAKYFPTVFIELIVAHTATQQAHTKLKSTQTHEFIYASAYRI